MSHDPDLDATDLIQCTTDLIASEITRVLNNFNDLRQLQPDSISYSAAAGIGLLRLSANLIAVAELSLKRLAVLSPVIATAAGDIDGILRAVRDDTTRRLLSEGESLQ